MSKSSLNLMQQMYVPSLTQRSAGNGCQLGFIAWGRLLVNFLVGTFDEELWGTMEDKGEYPKFSILFLGNVGQSFEMSGTPPS